MKSEFLLVYEICSEGLMSIWNNTVLSFAVKKKKITASWSCVFTFQQVNICCWEENNTILVGPARFQLRLEFKQKIPVFFFPTCVMEGVEETPYL